MKLTIDIDEDVLENAMRMTGETKKGPAVVKAAKEFIKRQLSREFATRVMEGEFGDYPLTNDELEEFDR
ncbi:MAG: type II toxin-antitoxin system VapB family antitoxin [Luteolibacter sp.]